MEYNVFDGEFEIHNEEENPLTDKMKIIMALTIGIQ